MGGKMIEKEVGQDLNQEEEDVVKKI